MNKVTNMVKIMSAVFLLHNCAENPVIVEDTQHELVGNWEMTELTMQLSPSVDPSVTVANDNFSGILVVNDDNTIDISYVSFGQPGSANGIWSVSGSVFTCEVEAYPYLSGEYTINNDGILVITSSSAPEEYSFIKELKFQKQ